MSLSLNHIQQNRRDFLDILQNTMPDLSKEMYEFLDKSDFFLAPASTRFHESYEGGLVQHSLAVYERLLMLNHQNILMFKEESMAKVALFHDICKVDMYEKIYRNQKMEDGRWIRTESYKVKEEFPLGHGEKSVALCLVHGVPLTEPEMLAIRWHMGGFDSAAKDFIGGKSLTEAMSKYKLVTALQLADMMSVWL